MWDFFKLIFSFFLFLLSQSKVEHNREDKEVLSNVLM